jgi:hypothetical protein
MPTNDYSQRRNGGLSRMRVRLPVPLPVSLVRPNQNLISRFELLPLSWCRDRKDLSPEQNPPTSPVRPLDGSLDSILNFAFFQQPDATMHGDWLREQLITITRT